MSLIHSCWALLAWRSSVIFGKASKSTKMSIETSSVGSARTASPAHSREVAASLSMRTPSSEAGSHEQVGAGPGILTLRLSEISPSRRGE